MGFNQTLIDDFHSVALDTTIWTLVTGTVTAGGSTVTLAAATTFPTIKSIKRFDIGSSILSFQVSQTGTGNANSQWFLEAVDASGNGVGIEADPTSATWAFDVDGAATVSGTVKSITTFWSTWTAGDYVGLGMSGTTMTLYKSTDRQTWTVMGTCTVGGTFAKNAVSLQISGGALTGSSTWACVADNASVFTVAIALQASRNRRRPVRPPSIRARIATPIPAQTVVLAPALSQRSPRTRARGLRIFRGRAATPVPGQKHVPPAPARRRAPLLAGIFRRRTDIATPVPPQVVVPPAYPPAPVRTRLRGLRVFRGRLSTPLAGQSVPATAVRRRPLSAGIFRRRTDIATPVPTQVVLPPAYAPLPVRTRLRGIRLFRGRLWAPGPDQLLAPGQQSARRRLFARRRPAVVTPVPVQVAPAPPTYPPAPVRTRLRGLRVFRGRAASPTPAQQAVLAPVIVLQAVRTRLRGLRLFRGRAATPVAGQITVAPPAYVPLSVRLRLRGLRIFRGRAAGLVPVQQTVPVLAYVPPSIRARVRALWPRRPRSAAPPIEQIAAPPAPHLRPHPFPPRRGHQAGPPLPQIIPPPAYVPAAVHVRGRGLLGRRGKAIAPPVAQIAPPVVYPTQTPRRRAGIFRLPRPRTATPVPPQIVIVPPPYPPTMTRVKKRFARIFRGAARWTPTAPPVVAPRVPTVTVDLARKVALADLSRSVVTPDLGRITVSVDLTRTIITVDLSRASVTVNL